MKFLCDAIGNNKTITYECYTQTKKKGKKISLYLDYYKDDKREYEYLNYYLVPCQQSGKLDKQEKEDNRKNLELAEAIRSKRLLEIKSDEFRFIMILERKFIESHFSE